jgi:hypothetical protein
MPMKGQPHPHRCQTHGMWLKKGSCELCIMEREAKRKEYELLGGSNKPKVFIKTI